MRTELQRHWPLPARLIMVRCIILSLISNLDALSDTSSQSLLFKGPVYGAYSELYAGFSPAVKVDQNGGHLMAWGRAAELPDDIIKGMKSEAEGGTGAAKKFFEYCNREIKDFL